MLCDDFGEVCPVALGTASGDQNHLSFDVVLMDGSNVAGGDFFWLLVVGLHSVLNFGSCDFLSGLEMFEDSLYELMFNSGQHDSSNRF